MANTGQSYGVDLELYDDNGVLQATLLNIDIDIDAPTLVDETVIAGYPLTLEQAQTAIDIRFKDSLVTCKPCLDQLPSNEFYAEILDENENSFYLNDDGSNLCKTYLWD